jgi:hypothetical protein
VPFEDAESKFLECCVESRGETLIVVARYVGDRDDVDVDPVSVVEWAVPAGQFRDRAQIRAPALQDVDICRGPHKTVALRDNESAETMKFRWARQLSIKVTKKRVVGQFG